MSSTQGCGKHRSAPVVHMIGNAHIDPAWLWTRAEGRREVLNTARTVVALMDEYPELTFSFSQAIAYQWIEQEEPELFRRIQDLAKQGRWHIVGGMIVQPDCNIPSGESFARHLLYAQRYFLSRFGRTAKVGYNVDSFGHAGTLPQLLRLGGLDYYVYFRPDPAMEVAMDEDIYWWQSNDGSRVLACRPPNHYCTWAGEIEAWVVNAVAHAPERVGAVLCFFGVGDHGGGPTRENIESIGRLAEREDLPEIRFGSLEAFFEVAERNRQDYAVRRRDLQHHAPGCYSAHSDIKRWNRQAEQSLIAVEKANAVLSVLGAGPLAGTPAFEDTWRRVLFNQFHDILAGTCIPEVYEDCSQDFAEVRRLCAGISQVVLERLAMATDCRGDGTPVLLFNPCSWERPANVELERRPGGAELAGDPVPCQRTHDGKLLLSLHLPPLGAACIHLVEGEAPSTAPMANEDCLENEFWRLQFDLSSGEWLSLFDKVAGVEVLARPGNALVVLDDPSDTWSHGLYGYHTRLGSFAEAEVIARERGPVRSSLVLRRRFGRSTITERISVYAGRRAIEVSSRLDWHDTRKALKVSFPAAIAYPVCTYEAPYGYQVRQPDGHEEPGQTWVDATGVAHRRTDGRALHYGLSLINDSKYGFDMTSHGSYSDPEAWVDVRMTLLRSPAYAFHDPRPFRPEETYTFLDQGEQSFTYWLLPHVGSWQDAGTARLAHELNAPVLNWETRGHDGALPPVWSFCECPDTGVELAALKLAEDGQAMVARIVETVGRDCQARLRFPLWGLELAVPLGHNQVMTLRIAREADSLTVEEADLLERPLAGGFRQVVSVAQG